MQSIENDGNSSEGCSTSNTWKKNSEIDPSMATIVAPMLIPLFGTKFVPSSVASRTLVVEMTVYPIFRPPAGFSLQVR